MAYDKTKPIATDKAGVSQNVIKNNFAAINTFIDINHVGFDQKNQGDHKKVTFIKQTDSPETVADEVALFAKLNSSILSLFLRQEKNGDEIALTGSGGLDEAGWSRLSSGLLIKWNKITITAYTSAFEYIEFPTGSTIPEFDEPFLVILNNIIGPLTSQLVYKNLVKKGFDVGRYSITPGTTEWYYLAIGV